MAAIPDLSVSHEHPAHLPTASNEHSSSSSSSSNSHHPGHLQRQRPEGTGLMSCALFLALHVTCLPLKEVARSTPALPLQLQLSSPVSPARAPHRDQGQSAVQQRLLLLLLLYRRPPPHRRDPRCLRLTSLHLHLRHAAPSEQRPRLRQGAGHPQRLPLHQREPTTAAAAAAAAAEARAP